MEFVSDWHFVLGVPMFDTTRSLQMTSGTRKKAVPFSPEEIELLRNRFPHERTDKLAEELGRSPETISSKARQLGLKKTAEFKKMLTKLKIEIIRGKKYVEEQRAAEEISTEIPL